ncbi:TPA: hypothetical protein SMS62_002564 [Pseudomonas aeruginosa]|nr:hypothetical protein [Pseudomonas aeruginosa]
MKKHANPAATVAAWNSAYPVGTEVDYRFHRGAAPKRTRTTTEAQILGGHTAVVWLAAELQIMPPECHFGLFDVDRCERAKRICDEYLEAIYTSSARWG